MLLIVSTALLLEARTSYLENRFKESVRLIFSYKISFSIYFLAPFLGINVQRQQVAPHIKANMSKIY